MPLIGKKCHEAYHGRSERCETCPTFTPSSLVNLLPRLLPDTGPDGSIAGWQDLYSFPLKDLSTGEFIGVIEYVRDVTSFKKTENDLRESEERLSLIEQAANDALFIVDGKGLISSGTRKLPSSMDTRQKILSGNL